MPDIRTRPSVGKRHGVLSKLVNKPNLTLQKLAEDCQRIVSVRKDSKNIEESGVAYVRKVKHRSQSYSPVNERKKNMITQNFNTGRLVTTKKKKQKNSTNGNKRQSKIWRRNNYPSITKWYNQKIKSSYWRTQKICLGQTGFRNLISEINQLIHFAKK